MEEASVPIMGEANEATMAEVNEEGMGNGANEGMGARGTNQERGEGISINNSSIRIENIEIFVWILRIGEFANVDSLSATALGYYVFYLSEDNFLISIFCLVKRRSAFEHVSPAKKIPPTI